MILSNWRYRQNNKWQEIPAWCHALCNLGRYVRQAPTSERLTVLLTLPAVDYAAVLIGLGVVLAQAEAQQPIDSEVHFNALSQLPLNSVVTYRDGDKIKDGLLAGVAEYYGKRYLVVRYGKTKVDKVPAQLSHLVQPSHKESIKLHKNQKGYDAVSNVAFLRAALPETDLEAYVRSTLLDFLLIGNRRRLLCELDEALGIHCEGHFHSGCLKELLRPTLGKGAGRCLIQSDRATLPVDQPPAVVIIEGAGGYLRFAPHYQKSHRVIVLDRCEARYEDAINEFNRAFMSEHTRELRELGDLPLACEAAGYVVVA